MSLELATGLRDAGFNVDLITSLWGDGEFALRAQKAGIPVYRMRLGYISATPRLSELRMTADQVAHVPSLWWSYCRFLRTHKPQRIIHTNWHHLLLLLPFLRPSRDLFWVHEVIPDKTQYRKLFRILSARLGCFIAVSQAVARSVVNLGIQQDQIRVIYNGLSGFDVVSSLPAATVRIGIVGQIGPWKGHDDLLAASAILKRKQINCEVHIFGSNKTSAAADLRALSDKLEISDRLHWHGFITDRHEIYSKIDICAVPSRFEDPLPTVAIEAGMAGLPCVATRQGGLPEIIEDGRTGLLVDRQNPDQLADALQKLISTPEVRMAMGKAAGELVRARFSKARFVKEFADLLEKC